RTMPEWINCNQVWHNFMTMALDGRDIVNFTPEPAPPYNNPFNQSQSTLYDKKDPTKAPSVVGMTLSAAAAALQGYDAEYVEEYSDTVPAGTVISQEVVNGKLRLHVSKGPDPNAVAPPNPGDGGGGGTNPGDGGGTNPGDGTGDGGGTSPGDGGGTGDGTGDTGSPSP
ncbi:MAG: PASTA domain-containing protein, partial [Eggerthellaceae bacterium]|nr:PASTA domain-containing protein [Eggerthellaceae bacterium]